MSLIKLTTENVHEISGKKIYGFGYSKAYLKEIDEAFGLVGRIEFIIDSNARNLGVVQFGEKNLEVRSLESIKGAMPHDGIYLIMSDYHQEAYDKLFGLLATECDCKIYYFENHESALEMAYRERYSQHDLENIIIFRSGPHASSYVRGMDFADNARALFEYMLANGYNSKYRLVWLIKYPDDFHEYDGVPNVEFLSFDWSVSGNVEQRDRYYSALCLAKFIFFTDAYGFARNCRKDQVRVQLWHGCGFKTRVNFARCEKRYEYNTVISDLYARIHEDIYGLRPDQVIVTGYAKEDWLFHPVERERFYGLGIPKADKYIFWLPTFRSTDEKLGQLNEYSIESEVGLPIIDNFEKLEELNGVLRDAGMVLVIKLHPFQKVETVHTGSFSNIYLLDNMRLVDADIQINQLLGYANALISDYSSAAVDYLVLDRPMAFTLDDVEEYNNSRGFVFENIKEWLPGREVYEWHDFIGFVREIAEGDDFDKDKRGRIKNVMHRFADDGSCRRITEALGICK
jgi:CDP-glycerol glycerophosphotransferase (TagB/SpsB family)